MGLWYFAHWLSTLFENFQTYSGEEMKVRHVENEYGDLLFIAKMGSE